MMKKDEVIKCICGKSKLKLNDINWSRHIASCEIRKRKITNSDIKSFFVSSSNSTQSTKKHKCKYLFI